MVMAFRFVQSKLMVFISIKRWRGSTPAWNSWRHLEETEHLVPADYLWTWGCQIEVIVNQWVRIHLPSLVPLVIAVHPENWPKCQFWPLVIIGGAEKQTARARMIKLTRRNRDAASTQRWLILNLPQVPLWGWGGMKQKLCCRVQQITKRKQILC